MRLGLTANSTGSNILNDSLQEQNCDYTIAIAGNPNVGKSTIFNSLTGMHQHTGNWPGKTVSNARGMCKFRDKSFLLVDIPGTYSIMSNSEEEEIARDYICFENPDATVVILDATCIERNLNLVYQIMEITPKIIVCVNLLDEAKKKKIHIDLKKLEEELGVPVVGTIARKKKTLDKLMEKIMDVASEKIKPVPNRIEYVTEIEDAINSLEELIELEKNTYLKRWIALKILDKEDKIINSIQNNLNINLETDEINNKRAELETNLNNSGITKENIRDKIVENIVGRAEKVVKNVVEYENNRYNSRDRKIDKILTSKTFGIPIMIIFLGLILWITIVGANYPSQWLSSTFESFKNKLVFVLQYIGTPTWLKGILVNGVYTTVTWIISVMLPPMAIFFPMFTLLEDLGVLPRIAFNLDKYFKKACSSRQTGTNHVHGTWL